MQRCRNKTEETGKLDKEAGLDLWISLKKSRVRKLPDEIEETFPFEKKGKKIFSPSFSWIFYFHIENRRIGGKFLQRRETKLEKKWENHENR